jgi:hypothetical protein
LDIVVEPHVRFPDSPVAVDPVKTWHLVWNFKSLVLVDFIRHLFEESSEFDSSADTDNFYKVLDKGRRSRAGWSELYQRLMS